MMDSRRLDVISADRLVVDETHALTMEHDALVYVGLLDGVRRVACTVSSGSTAVAYFLR